MICASCSQRLGLLPAMLFDEQQAMGAHCPYPAACQSCRALLGTKLRHAPCQWPVIIPPNHMADRSILKHSTSHRMQPPLQSRPEACQTTAESRGCRYLFQHRYPVTLSELVENITAPLVREEFEQWVYKPMDAWPTPEDYIRIQREGAASPCTMQACSWRTQSGHARHSLVHRSPLAVVQG